MEKLVRDNIPNIIGETANYRECTREQRLPLLIKKLTEEYHEAMIELIYCSDDSQRVSEEISDVLEVLEAICDDLNISWEDVLLEKEKKAIARGKFAKGYVLTIR